MASFPGLRPSFKFVACSTKSGEYVFYAVRKKSCGVKSGNEARCIMTLSCSYSYTKSYLEN